LPRRRPSACAAALRWSGAYRTYYLKEEWKAKWDCASCLKFVNFGLDSDVLLSWGYAKWPGLGEKQLQQKLNGEPSWMIQPKKGSGAGDGMAGAAAQRRPGGGGKPTFVSAATLKRQKEQAAHVKQHRSKGGGHAPISRGLLRSTEASSGGGSGWEAISGRDAYGEPPAHAARGGPMAALG